MARPVTLFTGQWADLPIDHMVKLTKQFGYDGIELACWGDHFEVDKAMSQDDYCSKKRALLDANGLQCHAISAHLVGQAVCDVIDERHKLILPDYVWGDGKPEGVNKRAIEELEADRASGSTFRRQRCQRFHRFQHLAFALFVPASFRKDDRSGL